MLSVESPVSVTVAGVVSPVELKVSKPFGGLPPPAAPIAMVPFKTMLFSTVRAVPLSERSVPPLSVKVPVPIGLLVITPPPTVLLALRINVPALRMVPPE